MTADMDEVKAKLLMDYRVPVILQARILKWVLFPSPGIEPRSSTLGVDSLPAEHQGSRHGY